MISGGVYIVVSLSLLHVLLFLLFITLISAVVCSWSNCFLCVFLYMCTNAFWAMCSISLFRILWTLRFVVFFKFYFQLFIVICPFQEKKGRCCQNLDVYPFLITCIPVQITSHLTRNLSLILCLFKTYKKNWSLFS